MSKFISIIIVNYNGERFLRMLFRSISEQTYKNYEVIFVDNNSHDNSLNLFSKLKSNFSFSSKIVTLSRNVGFAEGNNIAVKKAQGDYLLFLNTDASLDKFALEEMTKTIEKDLFIAGIAPKIYLSRFLPLKIFDSIGICMDETGSPYNRGIGQIDFKQYDEEEEVFGVCYAGALVRKEIFIISGGLDKTYFAYFEDVDWCFRVRKMGFKFLCCPKAVVYHYHSGTSSKENYEWKYYQIFRNFLRTIVKDFGKRNLLKRTSDRLRSLFSGFLESSHIERKVTILRIIINFILHDFFIYLWKRLNTRRFFISEITDEYLFSFSSLEPSIFFDPEKYQPIVNLKMLDFIIYRLNHLKPLSKQVINEWEDLKRVSRSIDYLIWKKEVKNFLNNKLQILLSHKEFGLLFKRYVR